MPATSPRLKSACPFVDHLKADLAKPTNAVSRFDASGRKPFDDLPVRDRAYSNAELEFMNAMREYKTSSGRLFPTWSETLEVVRGLGYEKRS